MKTLTAYRASVLSGGVLFLAYWFAPYAYGLLDHETGNVLAYGGFGASVELPDWYEWSYVLATVIGYTGALLFRRAFLWLYAGTFIVGLLFQPLLGVIVITGPEALVIDVSNALRGFSLALAYYTQLKDNFY